MAVFTSPDPPLTLQVAQQKFSVFLDSHGYPTMVCWLSPCELLVDTKCHCWIRESRPRTATRPEQKYAEGLERDLGIELRAICATDSETFAQVFVPADDFRSAVPSHGPYVEALLPCGTTTRVKDAQSTSMVLPSVAELEEQQGHRLV